MKLEEIKKFNGKDGNPAYVVYKGKIYDVSDSKLWKNGSHINRHFAGSDLSDQMAVAPHGDDKLDNFKIVGELEPDVSVQQAERKEKLRELYRKYHPHPMMVHFPIALFFFAGVLQFLFLLFNDRSFEYASFYALIGAALFTVPATLSGILSWMINYQSSMTKTFRSKLYLSILLFVFGFTALLLRIVFPELALESGAIPLVYNGILFASVPITALLGYLGGTITWPS